jgi:hypothetical protein
LRRGGELFEEVIWVLCGMSGGNLDGKWVK